MAEGPAWWVGTDEHGGIPNPGRPDVQPPPNWRLETVAATERPRQIELSPDGSTIAFVLDRDTSDVWTLSLAPGAQPQRVTTGRPLAAYWEDGNAVWSPDSSRLAYVQGGTVTVAAATGGVPREVCDGSSPVWVDDTRLIVTVDRHDRSVLALADIADPWPARVAAAAGDCHSAVVSPDRSEVAYLVFHHDDLNCTSIHVVDVDSGLDRTIVRDPAMNTRAITWSPDGSRIAYASELPGWYEVFVVDAAGGAPRQLTYAEADFSELEFTPDGDRLVGIRTRAGVADLVEIDFGSGDVRVLAAGGTFSSPRALPDGRIVVVHESFTTPARLCIVDRDGGVTELFAPTPLAVRSARHVVPEHVTYPSLDGMEVHGWLYRPPSADPDRPCPAVVQTHGGPTSLTGDEWDGVAQYFVDKGYAWLAINFRGSTSYGREFERADHGVWGVADTEDCLAAHDHLASLGWVDPSRVAIFGASYGSYMATHSVIDDPQHRYACAVAKYGDCDILTSWAQSDLVGRLDLERMMGHPRDARAAYRAGSPIHRVEQIEVPILVAHGELDERVHPAQALELVEALRRLGKQYEYVTYPTEGHGLLRTEPFLHFHRRLERFLDWY
ncbi:MAG: prolyl oligopeptidase family serine peptidase, partial [Ilumatobacteraceae bacterium]